jgi:oxaloacetate decarboxylase
LALLVDADHGYGNALNVRRTVEELETAGVCGLSIEDTVLPRPYGSGGKPTLNSVEEGIGKMKAALSARRTRTSSSPDAPVRWEIANLDEAVKRAKAYEAAGVDAIFLAGGATIEAVEIVSPAPRIPLILGGGSGQLGDLDWLAARRVRIALQTHAPFSAAVQAVCDTLKALRDGVAPRELKNVASPELMRQLTEPAARVMR